MNLTLFISEGKHHLLKYLAENIDTINRNRFFLNIKYVEGDSCLECGELCLIDDDEIAYYLIHAEEKPESAENYENDRKGAFDNRDKKLLPKGGKDEKSYTLSEHNPYEEMDGEMNELNDDVVTRIILGKPTFSNPGPIDMKSMILKSQG